MQRGRQGRIDRDAFVCGRIDDVKTSHKSTTRDGRGCGRRRRLSYLVGGIWERRQCHCQSLPTYCLAFDDMSEAILGCPPTLLGRHARASWRGLHCESVPQMRRRQVLDFARLNSRRRSSRCGLLEGDVELQATVSGIQKTAPLQCV